MKLESLNPSLTREFLHWDFSKFLAKAWTILIFLLILSYLNAEYTAAKLPFAKSGLDFTGRFKDAIIF